MLGEHTNAECRAATAAHDAEVRLTAVLPIARAAVRWRELDGSPSALFVREAANALEPLALAVDALNPEQRAEILESAETGGMTR